MAVILRLTFQIFNCNHERFLVLNYNYQITQILGTFDNYKIIKLN